MKTSKKSILSLLILTGVFMTACQKKSDSNSGSVATTPVVTVGCLGAGCVSSPGLLISASSSSASTMYGQFDFAMDFNGDSTRFNVADLKAVLSYQGPATMSGSLRITNGNFCGLQNNGSGTYTMQATQPGNMFGGGLSNARMTGTGPNNFRMDVTVYQAVLYNSADPQGTIKGSTTNGMFLAVRVDNVNGQPCGLMIYTP